MNHLLLVSLDWIRPKDPRTSLGHASLLARLQRAPNVHVTSLPYAVNAPHFRRERVLSDLLAAAACAPAGERLDIGIGVYVWNEPVVQWLLPRLREAGFSGRILLGGPQISYTPAGVDRLYPQADVFLRGFAEEALAAVVTASAARIDLPGVSYQGADTHATPAGVALDQLPSPHLTGVLPPSAFTRWETQRGCIYTCAFCQHRAPEGRARVQRVAEGRVADEIDWMVARQVRDIAVLDPIFHTNPQATQILHSFRARGFAGRLSLQSRLEDIDDDFLDACEGLDVQLEFGLQTTHRSEMLAVQRINHLERASVAIDKLHQRGLSFEISLIYGLPTQTLASLEASVRWCQARGVPVIRAFPLMLLRGTKLEKERARWGLVESEDEIPVVVESDSFSRVEWAQMRALAEGLEVANTQVRRAG